MWELQIANPFANLAIRKLLSLVAAALVTIFSYLLITTPNAGAADASWSQGSLTYNGQTYRGPTRPTPDHQLPDNSVLYTYLEPQAAFASQKMHVLYFPPGTDTAVANSASYVTYDRGTTGDLTNKSSANTVSIDAATLAESKEAANESTSSCKLDGIGWIICPITNGLAIGMDWVFSMISGFLNVKPLDTVTTSTMYNAWSVMRNFANVLFVIFFIFVIYSQLTSAGINNYGIKRALPRLIVAAILVNISYWICAILIDLSNILGYSFQDLFINMRNSIIGSNANSWELISWESLAAFILSGGAIGGAAIAGAAALTSTLAGSFAVGGLALVLAPILLGAFLTVMVVLMILAARQAIITLLVIIAPIAFVAFILPNTDKWFDKWRSLFMTMLIMFPAFSLVFGGAQLAGILIIQNAKDINTVLFGMAVQIAPLAITPLLFKLSGSLLGRIAGIVNNPSRGILDRTKNWSKDRLDARRAEQMSINQQRDTAGTLGKRNFARRTALRFDQQKRLREGKRAIDESDTTAMFNNSKMGRQLHEAQYASNNLKERVDTSVNTELKTNLNVEGSQLNLNNIKLEAAKAQLQEQEAITTQKMAEYRTAEYLNNHANPIFGNETIETIRALQAAEKQTTERGYAAQSAKRVGDGEFAQYMKDNRGAQEVAGGIEGLVGAQRSLATAIKTQSAHHQEAVTNAGTIIDDGNYKDNQITNLALGNSDTTGIEITEDIREAAIKRIAGGGNATEIINLVENIDMSPGAMSSDLRQALGDTLLTNSARPKWIGAGTTAVIKAGKYDNGDPLPAAGRGRLKEWVISTVNDNKLGAAETLVSQDKDYLNVVLDTISDKSLSGRINLEEKKKLKEQIHVALHDNRFKGRIAERDKSLGGIYDTLSDIQLDYNAPATYKDAKLVAPPRPQQANRPSTPNPPAQP